MMTRVYVLTVLLASLASSQSQHDHGGKSTTPSNEAFALVKGLVGEWKGTVKWTGARTGEGEMDARYYVTGNGSAVVEDLLSDGQPVMTTVYHLDGSDLRATHFCAAGNQPRLKADPFDEKHKSVDFRFVDITNLSAPDAPHVEALRLEFKESGQLVVIFTFTSSKGKSFEHITLTRTRMD